MFLTPKRVQFAKGATPDRSMHCQGSVFSKLVLSPETKGINRAIVDVDILDEEEVLRLLIPYQRTAIGQHYASDSDEEMSCDSQDYEEETGSVLDETSCQGGNDYQWEDRTSENASESESYASDDGEIDFQAALQKWVKRDVSIFPPKSPPTYHELRAFGPTKFDQRPEGMNDQDWSSVLRGTHDRWWNDLYAKHKAHTEYMARAKSPIGDRECTSRCSNTFWNDIDPQF
ncbi:hypothetical protein VNI00_003733 [Paramarasmius palmivorus]|uniref:Uncharacterized protein n=1 Tax=Paramarasmius palmivorus TaxID=297713 RepID=A0AAW0DSB1_9AGAR